MHGAFLTGLVSGLLLAVMISPVYFALINITITKGTEAGAMFVTGIFTGNLLLFIIAITGFGLLEYNFQHQRIIHIVSAFIVFVFCIFIIFNSNRKLISKKIIYFKATKPLTIYFKGILLNTLNPAVIVLWLIIFNLFYININGDKNHFVYYLSGVIITVLIFDILKLFTANELSNSVNPLYLLFINKIIAVFIIVSLFAFIF